MVSLNFTDKAVYLVSGGKNITDFIKIDLDPDTIRNGNIQNFNAVKTAIEKSMREAKADQSSVIVTVLCTQISDNEYVFPYTEKVRQIETMIEAEVAPMLKDGEYIYDYSERQMFSEENGSKKVKVDVFLAPRNLVVEYRNLMRALGFKKMIFDVVSSVFISAQYLIDIDFDRSLVAYAYDGMIGIFASNKGYFLQRKFFLQSISASADSEFASQIMKMIQFKQITFPDSPIETVYVFGAEVTQRTMREIFDTTGVKVFPMEEPKGFALPNGMDYSQYVFSVLAFIRGNRRKHER